MIFDRSGSLHLFFLLCGLLVCIVERAASFTAPPFLWRQNHQGGRIINKSLRVSTIAVSNCNHQKYQSRKALLLSVLNDDDFVVVAMTRELGKNAKLEKAIILEQSSSSSSSSSSCSSSGITLQPIELPCIAHADGPDYPRLFETLQNYHWDYVAVTSPEAARVLASVWKDCDFAAGATAPSVAAVGKATKAALADAGIEVAFCPSKATAATLVQELPMPPLPLGLNQGYDDDEPKPQQQPKVLYPASAKAQTTLQDGLRQRGFAVTRLDTYDTVTAVWSDNERSMAHQARIACFASPSAVKGWIQNYSKDDNDGISSNAARQVLAACIGETSAEACRNQGWLEENIFYPDKPGIEGWIEAIHRAAQRLVPVS